jgi:hypothetical protein
VVVDPKSSDTCTCTIIMPSTLITVFVYIQTQLCCTRLITSASDKQVSNAAVKVYIYVYWYCRELAVPSLLQKQQDNCLDDDSEES